MGATTFESFAVVYNPPTLRAREQAPVLARLATAEDATTFIGSLAEADPDGVDQGHYAIDGPCPEPVAVPTCPTAAVGPDGHTHTLEGCGSTNVAWDGSEMFDCIDCGLFFNPTEALHRGPAPVTA